MHIEIPEGLSKRVQSKFRTAKAAESLLFSPTELTIIRTSAGIPFQLRYCPSLAKKPEPRNDAAPEKKVDPFENPSSQLLIVDVPPTNPSHFLVLNKYPVIANHFILATRSNKPQAQVLEEDDLAATYACLTAWRKESNDQGDRLFAFFNSGLHSGASQAHRHLQFLPVSDMRAGADTSAWDILINSILLGDEDSSSRNKCHNSKFPFTYYACKFTAEPSSTELIETYIQLFQKAVNGVENYVVNHPDELSLHPTEGGFSPISYNLAMTTDGMAILPRRSDGHTLRRKDGSEIGFVQLNGTVLGGTLMVKYQEEWDLLRNEPAELDAILNAIGIPRR